MIIYDLEIQKLIPTANEDRLPDFEYCQGWHDHAGMGVACAVVFDTARGEYRIFDEFMLDHLKAAFARTDIVAGFNILKFDNKILESYDIRIPEAKCYDLLVEIAKAAGTPNDFKGLSLNAICQANFNSVKTGDGKNAPILFQRNRLGELFDYCMADVRLEKRLLDRILEIGHVINPRNNQWIRVSRPR